MSHTLATMQVSAVCYEEIKRTLQAAGYDHAFLEGGMIDMTGLAVVPPDPEKERIRRIDTAHRRGYQSQDDSWEQRLRDA